MSDRKQSWSLKSLSLIILGGLIGSTLVSFRGSSSPVGNTVTIEKDYTASSYAPHISVEYNPGASNTISRYKDALLRLTKLKDVGTSHVAACPLEIGWRQPENLVPHFIGNKCEPWWVRDAIFLIHHIMLPSWKVLEWGGGSSTVWFSSHAESVTTIEDSGDWVKDLGELLQKHNITNVQLRHRAKQNKGNLRSFTMGCCYDNYIYGASDIQDGTLDLVSVDGRARGNCLKEAIRLVKPKGGVLVLDNYDREWYQEAINTTIPKNWLRHYASILDEKNVTEAQKTWILKDNLFTTFWITR